MRSPLLVPVLVCLTWLAGAASAQRCGDLTCASGGECALDAATNQTYCKCKPDFAGQRCELTVCADAYAFKQQCKNNGKCYMSAETKDDRKFQCVCDEEHQFTGALCEKSVCADYCLNDNRCEVLFNTTTTTTATGAAQKVARPACTCTDSRYAGDRCEFDRCLEAKKSCPRNCSLTTSSCKCECGPACDASYCNSNGVCVEKNDKLGCKCKVGYSGDTCFVDDCKGYCFYNGTCKRSEETGGVSCECSNGSTEKRCSLLPDSKATEDQKPLRSKFQIIRVVIYGITIILLLCLFTICAYVFVQRGYADRLFQKRQASTTEPAPRNSATRLSAERVRNFLPSFRFFKSSQTFNRLDDEQPITHYENANV